MPISIIPDKTNLRKETGEKIAFQRKKLLIFSGLAALTGLLLWANHLAEANSTACIRCQQRLASNKLNSLTLIGSLRTPGSIYSTYYQTIRDTRLLRRLVQLSRPGPKLLLSGTERTFFWHEYQFDAAQTQAGQPYTDCYSDYTFTANQRLLPVLDSLPQTKQDGRW